MNPLEQLAVDVFKDLMGPAINAIGGAESPEQIEAERQALILAQRRIQEEIARRELPP